LSGATVRWSGSNNRGQLGNGRVIPCGVETIPVQVTGIGNATQISAGGGEKIEPNAPPLTGEGMRKRSHSCAQLSNGAARCGGEKIEPNPPPFTGEGLVKRSHSCAQLSNGEARCWGDGQHGQLGHGTEASSSIPVAPDLSSIDIPIDFMTSVETGNRHTCARV